MSDLKQWWYRANRGIIGLAPLDAEYLDDDVWPTGGYDGPLREYAWREDYSSCSTGHSQAEWLALADEMVARWQAWRDRITAMPADDPAFAAVP